MGQTPRYGLLLLALVPTLALAQPAFVPGEVIFKYRAGARSAYRSEKRALVAQARPPRALGLIGAEHLRFESIATEQAIAILRADPAVEYAEPNYLIYADVLPNDPRFPEQWGLRNIGQGL